MVSLIADTAELRFYKLKKIRVNIEILIIKRKKNNWLFELHCF